MNKREAKRHACSVMVAMIENYFSLGQPWNDCNSTMVQDWKPEDEPRLKAAFQELLDEMDRRSAFQQPADKEAR